MNKELNKSEKPIKDSTEVNLKGTFVSVMILGAFLIVSWVGIYILFISR